MAIFPPAVLSRHDVGLPAAFDLMKPESTPSILHFCARSSAEQMKFPAPSSLNLTQLAAGRAPPKSSQPNVLIPN